MSSTPAVGTRAVRSEGWFGALGVNGRRASRAGAIACGVFGYVLAMLAPLALPETHAREIRAVE